MPTIQGSSRSNYYLSQLSNSPRTKIIPKPLTVTPKSGQYKLSGLSDPAFLYDVAGLVAGEPFGYTGALTRDLAGTTTVGNHNITLGSLALADNGAFLKKNYTLNFTTGVKFEVRSNIELTVVNSSAVGRAYDRTTVVTIVVSVLQGIFPEHAGGVSIKASTLVGNADNKNAGNNKAVTITGIQIEGTYAAGYTVKQPPNVQVNITKKTVTVTVTAGTSGKKTYDGNVNVPLTFALGTVISGDVVSISTTATGTVANADASTVAKGVNYSKPALTGTDGANYEPVFTPDSGVLTVTIEKRVVAGTATAADRPYDGTKTVSVSFTLSNVAPDGSDVRLAGVTGDAASKDAGTRKVTYTAPGLTGTHAANYTLSGITPASNALDVVIGKADLTVTPVSGQYKRTGQTDPVFTYNFSGAIGGETAAASGLLSRDSAGGQAAGNFNIIIGTLVLANGTNGFLAANYNLVFVSGISFGVLSGVVLTVTGVTAVSRMYNGLVTVELIGGTLVGVDTVDVGKVNINPASRTGNMANNSVGNNKNVTTALTLSGDQAAGYSLQQPTEPIRVNITPIELTVTATVSAKTYDGSNSVNVSLSLDTTGKYASDSPALATTTASGSFVGKEPGSGKSVTYALPALNGTGASNYTIKAKTGTESGVLTVTVNKKTLTATATALDKIYDRINNNIVINFVLNGIVNSENVSLPSLSNGEVTTADAGTAKKVTYTAPTALSGADASNYTLGTVSPASNTLTVNITPKALSATAAATAKTYDGLTNNIAVSFALVGIISGDSVTLAGLSNGTVTNRNAGMHAVSYTAPTTLGGTHAANYTISASNITLGSGLLQVEVRTANLSVTSAAVNKEYDGNTSIRVTFTISGGKIGSDDVAVPEANGQSNVKDAGSRTVTFTVPALSGTTANNYVVNSVSPASGSLTVTISKKAVTAKVTAENRAYNRLTTVTVNFTDLSGIIAGDSASLSISSAADATVSTKAAGDAKTVTLVSKPTLTGGQANNYELSLTPTTVTVNISKIALTATAAATNKGYDGNNTVTVKFTLSGIVSGDAVTLADDTNAKALDKNAGIKSVTYTVAALGGTDAANYTLAAGSVSPMSGGVPVEITKKALTVMAAATNKEYDGNTEIRVTFTITAGKVGVDEVLVPETIGSVSTKDIANGKAVTYTVPALGGAEAQNYSATTVTPASGTLTVNITKRTLTARVVAENRVYDGTNKITVNFMDLGTVLGSDNVYLSINSATDATVADKKVGTGKAVTVVTQPTLAGLQAGNYTLNLVVSGVTVNITPKTLTATAAATNKTYDGNNTVTVKFTLSGKIGADDVTLADDTNAKAIDKNAGAKSVSYTAPSLGGTDAGNYTLGTVSPMSGGVSVDITKKPLTATATAVNKTYDGSRSITVKFTLSGKVGADEVALADITGEAADALVGSGKNVTYTPPALTGAESGNYSILTTAITPTSGNLKVNITVKTITAKATAADKVYDGLTTVTVTFELAGIVGNDAVTLGPVTDAAARAKDVGTRIVDYTTPTLAGAQAANYTLGTVSPASGVLTVKITKAPITVTVAATNRDYNGKDDDIGVKFTVVGKLGSDTVSLNDVVGKATSKDAGVRNVTYATPVDTDLKGTHAGNYTITNVSPQTGVLTVEIYQKLLTATAAATAKEYDGTTDITVKFTLAGLISGDSVTLVDVIGAANNKNAANNKDVTYTIPALSGPQSLNYKIGASNVTPGSGALKVNITPRKLVVTPVAGQAKYPVDPDPVLRYTDSNAVIGEDPEFTGNLTRADANGSTIGEFNITIGTLAMINNGTFVAANYTVQFTANVKFVVTSAIIVVITGVTAVERTYNGTVNVVLNWSGQILPKAGGAAILGIGADISGGGKVATADAGTSKNVTTNIGLTGTSANAYTLEQPTVTVNITKAQLTLTGTDIDISDKTYDATKTATLHGLTFRGYVNGERDAEYTVKKAEFTAKTAGDNRVVNVEVELVATGAVAKNYTLTNGTATAHANIAKAQLTSAATAVNRPYDTTNTVVVKFGALSGKLLSDDVSIAVQTGGTMLDKTVGTGKTVSYNAPVTTGADKDNYTLTVTPVSDILTVNITAIELTATAAAVDRAYNGTTNVTVNFTLGTGDILGPDNVSLTAVTVAGIVNSKTVGTKYVTYAAPALTGRDAANYTLTMTPDSGDLQVVISEKLITATALAAAKTYDGNRNVSVSFTLSGIEASDTVTLAGVTGTASEKNAGVRTVSYSAPALGGGSASNYTLSGITPASNVLEVTINKLNITANATAANRAYDGTDVIAVSFTPNGILGGDQVTAAQVNGTATTKNAGNVYVTYNLPLLNGTDALNYNLTSASPASGALSAVITPKALRVTPNAGQFKVIGLPDPLPYTYAYSGNVTGETPEFSGALDRDAGTGVGLYGILQGTLNIVDNAVQNFKAANYEIDFDGSVDFEIIDKIVLTITGVTGVDRAYNGSSEVALSGGALSGIVSGDEVTFALGTGSVLSGNAGDDKAVTTLVTIGGRDAAKYVLTQPGYVKVNIAKAALTIDDAALKDKVYNGLTAGEEVLSVTFGGLVASETLAIGTDYTAVSGTYASANAGSRAVSVTVTLLNSAISDNYALPVGTAEVTGKIVEKELTVDVSDIYASYTGSNHVIKSGTAYTVTGLENGEQPGVLGLTLIIVGGPAREVGIYGIGAELTNGNYAVTLVNGKYHIEPATPEQELTTEEVDAMFDDVSLVYNGQVRDAAEYYNNLASGLTGIAGITVEYTGSFGFKNVGGDTLTLVLKAASGYGFVEGSGYASEKRIQVYYEITKKELTLTGIPALTKAYDGNDGIAIDVTNADILGAITGDEVRLELGGLTALTGQLDSSAVGHRVVIAILESIDLSGASAGNYTLAIGSLTAEITPQDEVGGITGELIEASYGYFKDQTKEYDGTAQNADFSAIDGTANVTIDVVLQESEAKNVGVYHYTITVTADAGYGITYQGGYVSVVVIERTLTITPRELKAEIENKSVIKGGAQAALTYKLTSGSIAAGDSADLIIRLSCPDYADAVGSYAIIGECLDSNYSVIFINGVYKIEPDSVEHVVDEITGAELEALFGDTSAGYDSYMHKYEGSSAYDVSGIEALVNKGYLTVNFVNDDNIDAGEHAVTIVLTTVGDWLIYYPENAQYAGRITLTRTLEILKRAITVTVGEVAVEYNDTFNYPALSYSLTGGTLADGDLLDDVVTVGRESGVDVGSYRPVCSVIDQNYEVKFEGGKYVILPKEIIEVSDLDKITDQNKEPFKDETALYDGQPHSYNGNSTIGSIAHLTVIIQNVSAIDAGIYTVTISLIADSGYGIKTGEGVYESKVEITRTLTVEKRKITVTVDSVNNVKYSAVDRNAKPVANVTEGSLHSGANLDEVIKLYWNIGGVGVYEVISELLNDNYALTLKGGTYSVVPDDEAQETVPANLPGDDLEALDKGYFGNQTAEYDGSYHSYDISAGTAFDSAHMTVNVVNVSARNVGVYTVKIIIDTEAGYGIKYSDGRGGYLYKSHVEFERTLTVTKKALTVEVKDQSGEIGKVVFKDDNTQYTINGLVAGDSVRVTLNSVIDRNAIGYYAISAAIEGGDVGNYELTVKEGRYNVKPESGKMIDEDKVAELKGLAANSEYVSVKYDGKEHVLDLKSMLEAVLAGKYKEIRYVDGPAKGVEIGTYTCKVIIVAADGYGFYDGAGYAPELELTGTLNILDPYTENVLWPIFLLSASSACGIGFLVIYLLKKKKLGLVGQNRGSTQARINDEWWTVKRASARG